MSLDNTDMDSSFDWTVIVGGALIATSMTLLGFIEHFIGSDPAAVPGTLALGATLIGLLGFVTVYEGPSGRQTRKWWSESWRKVRGTDR